MFVYIVFTHSKQNTDCVCLSCPHPGVPRSCPAVLRPQVSGHASPRLRVPVPVLLLVTAISDLTCVQTSPFPLFPREAKEMETSARRLFLIQPSSIPTHASVNCVRLKVIEKVYLICRGGGGGVPPYMGYIGMCRGIGYGF